MAFSGCFAAFPRTRGLKAGRASSEEPAERAAKATDSKETERKARLAISLAVAFSGKAADRLQCLRAALEAGRAANLQELELLPCERGIAEARLEGVVQEARESEQADAEDEEVAQERLQDALTAAATVAQQQQRPRLRRPLSCGCSFKDLGGRGPQSQEEPPRQRPHSSSRLLRREAAAGQQPKQRGRALSVYFFKEREAQRKVQEAEMIVRAAQLKCQASRLRREAVQWELQELAHAGLAEVATVVAWLDDEAAEAKRGGGETLWLDASDDKALCELRGPSMWKSLYSDGGSSCDRRGIPLPPRKGMAAP